MNWGEGPLPQDTLQEQLQHRRDEERRLYGGGGGGSGGRCGCIFWIVFIVALWLWTQANPNR
jgi:hypothetical protein